jgi:hypothetical protein
VYIDNSGDGYYIITYCLNSAIIEALPLKIASISFMALSARWPPERP